MEMITGRFRTFTLPESFWNRSKMIFLDQEIDFKKRSSKNSIFFWSKTIFKKKVENFFRIFSDFQISTKSTFSKNTMFFENVDFVEILKIEKNSEMFLNFFWKYFSTRKNYFFRSDFFLTSSTISQLSNELRHTWWGWFLTLSPRIMCLNPWYLPNRAVLSH